MVPFTIKEQQSIQLRNKTGERRKNESKGHQKLHSLSGLLL